MRRGHPLLKRRSLAVSVSQRSYRRGGSQAASLLPNGAQGLSCWAERSMPRRDKGNSICMFNRPAHLLNPQQVCVGIDWSWAAPCLTMGMGYVQLRLPYTCRCSQG